MIQKFCVNCGHRAPLDCKFCEECGVSLDEIAHHQEPATPLLNLNPFASLYDFVKHHLAVINGVVLFSGTVVGVLDFCVPVLKPILVILYWMTGGLSVLMLLAALFPALWMKLISKLGYGNEGGKHTAVPLHKRDAWRGAIVLLMGVTAAGVVSLAKANQGGALASSFPSLKTLQESMLSLNQKTDQIQMGVKDANSKLDQIVKSVDPENAGDNCSDISCALAEGASLEILNKLWNRGSRLPKEGSTIGLLVKDVVLSKRENRLAVLDFLYSHSIAKDFQFDPLLLDASFLPPKKMQLMDRFWKSAKQSDNLVRGTVDQKKRALEKWGFLSYCIYKTDGGVNLIQFAALIDDEELLKHLAETGSKTLLTAVSCRSEELGKIVVSNGQVKQLPPIVTFASILFNDLGEGQIVTRFGDKP